MKATSEGRSTGIAGQGDTARGNVDACNCNVQEARRRERVCRGGLESRKVWVGCGAPQKRDRPPGAMSAWACLALVLVAKRHERGKGDGSFRVVVNGGATMVGTVIQTGSVTRRPHDGGTRTKITRGACTARTTCSSAQHPVERERERVQTDLEARKAKGAYWMPARRGAEQMCRHGLDRPAAGGDR